MSSASQKSSTLSRLLAEIKEREELPITLLDRLLERERALGAELPRILRAVDQVPLVDDRPLRGEERRGPLRLLTPAGEIRLSKRIEFTRRRLERTIALADVPEEVREGYFARIDVPERPTTAARRRRGSERPGEAEIRARYDEFLAQRNELVEANLALVERMARKYGTYNIPHGDLVQHGNLGLIRAAEKFDWRRKVRFRTYADYWIRQAIERATDTDRDVIHVPRPMRQLLSKANLRNRELGGDRPLDAQRIVELTDADPIAARTALSIKSGIVSIDRAGLDEDGSPMRNDIEGPDLSGRREREEREHLQSRIRGLLETLPEREQQVLNLRYGLDGGPPHTLEEVGEVLHISRERVRQLQMRAIDQLRTRSQELEEAL